MPPAPTLDAAIALHQAGRRAEAEAAYAAILAAQPEHPGALHALGVLRQQLGDSAGSAALIERAIARQPDAPEFHFNLGLARFRLGAFHEAAAALAEAARLKPGWPQAHYDLGNALREAGDLDGAARAFRAALKLRPEYVEAEVNLANVLRAAGKREQAVAAYRRVLRRRPDAAEARANLAAALLDEGDTQGAAAEARTALAAAPALHQARATLAAALLAEKRYAEAAPEARRLVESEPEVALWRDMLGHALRGAFRPEQALAEFDTALRLDPDLVSARFGRAEALRDLHRPETAEAELRKLVTRYPERWETHQDLANALRDLGRFAEAEEAYRASLALSEQPRNLTGLGAVLRDLARVAESEAVLRQALRRAPRDPEIRYNLATTLLTAGKYAEGFAQYDSRFEYFRPVRPASPAWTGEPIRGRTLLVAAEQGMGDAIQFIRTLPVLAQRTGARIVLQAHDPLHPLLRDFPGVAQVIGLKDQVAHECHAMLLSLPHLLKLTDPAPIAFPYLRAEPESWTARLAPHPRPWTGLVWAGNPGYRADRLRSLPAAALTPFGALPGTLVSLQKDGARPVAPTMLDVSAELTDFGVTAQVIAALDRVVAVDTAVAHLAGAMGKPVVLLNRFDSDWRWAMSGETTAWYPSMRIARQPAPGDWGGAVAAALAMLDQG